ncbi:MAG: phospho-N-acetylmuramoyl-pentapeptide-transferase [Oscillospiraceae bacterium]|nr:phospho-N-acetylmuramoyl-pentapeptide-transferase [Oscillospiraceae bacterium]
MKITMMDLEVIAKGALLPFLIGLAVTLISGTVFIPWLHKLKFGQEIREEGPKWHQKKSGTPTMGGIMFIVGIGIAAIVCTVMFAVGGNLTANTGKLALLFIIALGFGIIGFTDDYIKVVKKRNLGLTAIQKFLLQLLLTIVYIAALTAMGGLNTAVKIPFTSIEWVMPVWLYIPFVMFVMIGVVNAVNLTDGLDGLASSVTVIVSLFFAFAAAFFEEHGIFGLAAASAGALIGFLVYNKYPARVFMGDTGSLFLGALVALMAIDMGLHIYLIIVGFVYFAETLSVILQTSYFKYTKKKYGEGRRIFKMSPLHHHFEMCSWSEKKIVGVFSLTTLILCAVAYAAIFMLG